MPWENQCIRARKQSKIKIKIHYIHWDEWQRKFSHIVFENLFCCFNFLLFPILAEYLWTFKCWRKWMMNRIDQNRISSFFYRMNACKRHFVSKIFGSIFPNQKIIKSSNLFIGPTFVALLSCVRSSCFHFTSWRHSFRIKNSFPTLRK